MNSSPPNSTTEQRLKSLTLQTTRITKTATKKIILKKEYKNRSRSPMQPIIGPLRSHRKHVKGSAPPNINLDFTNGIGCEIDEQPIRDEKSNMFLYIDLHGHASKKGVFMYGNHLPNSNEAVECMLLPRLMTMNCHHFHFDACNFSERNMYLK